MKYDFIAFTDGSAIRKEDTFDAGSASIVLDMTNEKIYKFGKALPDRTSNYAELHAIYSALETVKRVKRKNEIINILIVSDSQYSINVLDKLIHQWVRKHGKNPDNWDKKNTDIISLIYNKFLSKEEYIISFIHMNSHKSEKDVTMMGDKIELQNYSANEDVIKLFIKYNAEADKICQSYRKSLNRGGKRNDYNERKTKRTQRRN